MGMQSIGGGKYLIKNKNSKKCIHSRKMRKYNQHFNHYNCNKRNSAQQYYIINAKAKSRKLKIKKNNRRSRVPKKGPKVGPKGKGPKKGPKEGPKGKGPKGKGPKVGPKGKGPKGKGPKGKGPKGNKMKYRKKKTLKFMKGKYSFNLKTGKKFCSTKCKNNPSSKDGFCFMGGVKKCKGCSFTGDKKSAKGKESQQLCSIVCRSIKNKTCNFYAYIDEKKKVINKKLLNRFGRIFTTKFLQKK